VSGAFSAAGPAIVKYDELLKITDEGPSLEVNASCVSDSLGIIYLPARGKLVLKEASVQGAALLNGKGEDVKLNDLPCLKFKIDKPDSAVIISLTYDGKSVVQEKPASLGTTYPGGVLNYSRTFQNTTPLDIKNYSITLRLPAGMDIYQVLKPNKPEKYQLASSDGGKTVILKSAAIKAGGNSELSVDVYIEPRSKTTIIWILAIGLSIFMLIMRRDIIKQAIPGAEK